MSKRNSHAAKLRRREAMIVRRQEQLSREQVHVTPTTTPDWEALRRKANATPRQPLHLKYGPWWTRLAESPLSETHAGECPECTDPTSPPCIHEWECAIWQSVHEYCEDPRSGSVTEILEALSYLVDEAAGSGIVDRLGREESRKADKVFRAFDDARRELDAPDEVPD